jgi:hypothetical protein
MSLLQDQLRSLRQSRMSTIDVLGGASEEQLSRPATLNERQVTVRHLLAQLAGGDDERIVLLGTILSSLGWQQTEAQRILAGATQVRGQLLACLVGLPDEYLGKIPRDGEWTAGQALEHSRLVEERYIAQTAYGVERLHSAENLPVEMPSDRLPPMVGAPASPPALAPLLSQMASLREEAINRLAGYTAEDLAAPSVYGRRAVDIRYRLHRLAAHEREHMAQVEKTLQAVGWRRTEAQIILGYANIARGKLESMLIGLPDELLERRPQAILPSINVLLSEAVVEEQNLVTTATEALR